MLLRPAITIEPELRKQLTEALNAYFSINLAGDFRSVAIVEELYNRTGIYIACWTSIEQYETEEPLIILRAMKGVLPYIQQYLLLEGVLIRVDIYDDKVGISDTWFGRTDILLWAAGHMDDQCFLEQGESYW